MNSKNINNISEKFILTYFILCILFSRAFVGIYVFNFRLGELVIAFGLFFFIFSILQKNKISNFNPVHKNVFILILVSFFITLITTKELANLFSDFLNPYTYKSSSYIWSLSFFILGLHFSKIKLSNFGVVVCELLIVSNFIFAIYGLPDFIESFFVNYSDKYELQKGSDIALNFIVINYLIQRKYSYTKFSYIFLSLNVSLILPLALYKSRAAFISILVYVFYEVFQIYKKRLLLSKLNLVLLIPIFLILSSSTYLSQTQEYPEEVSAEIIANSYSGLGKYRLKHFQEELPFLYFQDSRVYSGDGNLNWRLDMWQDMVDDLFSEKNTLLGFGYTEKFMVFQVDNTGYGNNRVGLDEKNENLHNYFLNIFSRGGLVQLFLFLFFYFYCVKYYKSKIKDNKIIIYLFCLLFISSFDSSMENSHYPLIFYYFLGNQFLKLK